VKYLIENKKENLDVVEVGVHAGQNALVMLHDLKIKRMYLVDPYKAYVDKDSSCSSWYIYDSHSVNLLRRTAECNIALNAYGDKAKFLILKSNEAVNLFPDQSLDFVYIDASHSRPDVDEDINIWYPKVRFGGMLGGHDWCIQDVQDAVRAFAAENNIKLQEELFETDWFIIK
jgi:hypothetical protein